MTDPTPTLGKITRQNGVAGQFAYTVPVTYAHEGAERHLVTFVGSVYGGRVVMVTPGGHQTFVSADVMERCGETLTPEWVRRFFRVDN